MINHIKNENFVIWEENNKKIVINVDLSYSLPPELPISFLDWEDCYDYPILHVKFKFPELKDWNGTFWENNYPTEFLNFHLKNLDIYGLKIKEDNLQKALLKANAEILENVNNIKSKLKSRFDRITKRNLIINNYSPKRP